MDEISEPQLLLCVPGPWPDRCAFVRSIISESGGEFVFAGMILANPKKQDHINLELSPRSPEIKTAFEIAGQGKLPSSMLEEIDKHQSVAYLHFPVTVMDQVERLRAFTHLLMSCGGIAVKVESSGIAHQWDSWFSALTSDNPFDLYRSFVVLIGDSDFYYSCGMHHFGLPDVEVSRAIEIKEAAYLMNRFNYWQIVERPTVASGHTSVLLLTRSISESLWFPTNAIHPLTFFTIPAVSGDYPVLIPRWQIERRRQPAGLLSGSSSTQPNMA